jgi:hypothetical protein
MGAISAMVSQFTQNLDFCIVIVKNIIIQAYKNVELGIPDITHIKPIG